MNLKHKNILFSAAYSHVVQECDATGDDKRSTTDLINNKQNKSHH